MKLKESEQARQFHSFEQKNSQYDDVNRKKAHLASIELVPVAAY